LFTRTDDRFIHENASGGRIGIWYCQVSRVFKRAEYQGVRSFR